MRSVLRLVMVAAVLVVSVVAVLPVSAAPLPANNDLNASLVPTVWPPYPPCCYPVRQACYNYYRVRWGDTLSRIAWYYRTSVWALMAANPYIWNPNVIYAGQVLCIPYPTYPTYPMPVPY